MNAVMLTDELASESRFQAREPVDGTCALILDARGNPTWRYRTEVFREAFLCSRIDGEELDRRCKWTSGYHARVLGLRPELTTRRGRNGKIKHYRTVRRSVGYEQAVLLCRALDLNFVEWGV